MRTSYILLGLVALLSACTGGKKEADPQKEFTITGSFAGTSNDGQAIYLQTKDADGDKYTAIDTATITNASFTFKRPIGVNDQILYVSTESMAKPALFIAEQGVIEMAFDSTNTATIKGTSLNDKYQEYATQRLAYDNNLRELSKLAKQTEAENKMTPELGAQLEAILEAKADSIYDASKQYNFDFAKANINNVVGEYVLLDRGRSFDEKQLSEILPLADPKLKDDARFKNLEIRHKALVSTAVGQKYVNLTGKTPDGKEISLSDYVGKNKLVLIDFWASWCPPCRKEMPKVVALYNEYKDKGFQIVGVSLDKTNEDWVKGIKELNITWPQMSDLKYWQSDLSAAYAVNSIPHMVLINESGLIVARGITADQLAETLAKDLK